MPGDSDSTVLGGRGENRGKCMSPGLIVCELPWREGYAGDFESHTQSELRVVLMIAVLP